MRISKCDTIGLIGTKEGSERSKRQGAAIRRQRNPSDIDIDENDSASPEAVCVECFRFLKAVAKGYSQVQEG